MTGSDARDGVAAWGLANIEALQQFQAVTIELRDSVQSQVDARITDDLSIAEIARRGVAPARSLLEAEPSGDLVFDEALSLACSRWLAGTDLMRLAPYGDQAERDAAIAEVRASLGGLAMVLGRMFELGFTMPGM